MLLRCRRSSSSGSYGNSTATAQLTHLPCKSLDSVLTMLLRHTRVAQLLSLSHTLSQSYHAAAASPAARCHLLGPEVQRSKLPPIPYPTRCISLQQHRTGQYQELGNDKYHVCTRDRPAQRLPQAHPHLSALHIRACWHPQAVQNTDGIGKNDLLLSWDVKTHNQVLPSISNATKVVVQSKAVISSVLHYPQGGCTGRVDQRIHNTIAAISQLQA